MRSGQEKINEICHKKYPKAEWVGRAYYKNSQRGKNSGFQF
jgi:hypothetical protein